jgi:hypothetical protein
VSRYLGALAVLVFIATYLACIVPMLCAGRLDNYAGLILVLLGALVPVLGCAFVRGARDRSDGP